MAVAFVAGGGQRLQPTAYVELGLVLTGAALGCAAILRAPPGRTGLVPLAGFAALVILTVASIAWSINPSDSWEEANRVLSYLAIFGGALALARLVPWRWRGVLAGIGLASVAIVGYGLMTRIAPALLAEDEIYARLREPFGYWNAVGATSALGIPALLWAASRRSGAAWSRVLAWPGISLLLVGLMLSYSRGALVALLVGLAFWFAVVPLRLRAAAVLTVAATGAAGPVAWAFSQPDLTQDNLALAVRADAGVVLGALLTLMVTAVLLAAAVLTFAMDVRPVSARTHRRLGRSVLAAVLLAPILGALALASAPGGLDGQISKAYDRLTDADARTPSNTPGRLTSTASVRARYWREALDVQSASPWIGTGAGGYATARSRFRTSPLEVRHAHGYVAQVLADFGWIGVGVSLLALLTWVGASARATRHRAGMAGAERQALLTLVAIVVVFGAHSLVDWTWFIPANAAVALLAAGWVAGRGPGRPAATRPTGRSWRSTTPSRIAWAAVTVTLSAAIGVAILQPALAVDAGDVAIAHAQRGDFAAAAKAARRGAKLNPLAVEPLWEVAVMEHARGRRSAAVSALEKAVQLQPGRAEAWTRLGRYRLSALNDREGALKAFVAAAYLDPASPAAASDVLEAQRSAASG